MTPPSSTRSGPTAASVATASTGTTATAANPASPSAAYTGTQTTGAMAPPKNWNDSANEAAPARFPGALVAASALTVVRRPVTATPTSAIPTAISTTLGPSAASSRPT